MDRVPAHQPVLQQAMVGLLQPESKTVLLDCTVGLGGHAEALLQVAPPDAQLIALDVDAESLRLAKQRLAPFGERARLFHANFSQLPDVLTAAGLEAVDLLLADLGVSSSQLDDPDRGLSFQADGPLDMRLDRQAEETAADLVNQTGEQELADLIYAFGEERYSRRIARAIVAARRSGRIERTVQFAELVERAYPAAARRSRRGVHPATRTFQALRIAVNDELGALDTLLELVPQVLAVGGRAGIISFHSLEDRRVKQTFAELAREQRARLLTKKPIRAAPEELAANPRSRSARLRGIEQTARDGR